MKIIAQNTKNFFDALWARPDDSIHYYDAPTSTDGIISEKTQCIPENFSLCIWNAFKGRKDIRFHSDLETLLASNDFVCLQEALLCSKGTWAGEIIPSHFVMNSHYVLTDHSFHGLLTGASVKALPDAHSIMSLRPEPVVQKFKGSLRTKYRYSGSNQYISVVNTHLSFFQSLRQYERELKNVFEHIAALDHPAVFCGDFNCRSKRHLKMLSSVSEEYGFERIAYENDWSNLSANLDQILIKGLEIDSARVVYEVTSSDHVPLVAKLREKIL